MKILGILTISSTTVDEQLSIDISNQVYAELKKYYLESSTKATKLPLNSSKLKRIQFCLMKAKEYQLSAFNDSHRNLTNRDY